MMAQKDGKRHDAARICLHRQKGGNRNDDVSCINPHNARGYGYYLSFFVFPSYGDPLSFVLISILLIH